MLITCTSDTKLIEMNFAVFIYYFFVNVLLVCSDTAPSTSTALKCPGPTACSYYGSTDDCDQPVIPVSSLPTNCTGFFFFGFIINDKFAVQSEYNLQGKEYVTELAKVKPTFAAIEFFTCFNWDHVLNPDKDLKPQLDSIQTYFKGINLSGFVLYGMFEKCGANLQNITQKLETYVKYMKACLPEMSFGLSLDATDLKNNIDNLDFTILSTTFEFLLITFDKFNECSSPYEKGGIVPLDGTAGNTLNNFRPIITKAMVHPMQVILMFEMNIQIVGETPTTCYTPVDKRCSGEDCVGCCMEDSTTLYEKGNFAKLIGASIVANNIDLDDSGCKCECGFPFPAFTFLLNGFNNGDKTLKCPKFDGTPA